MNDITDWNDAHLTSIQLLEFVQHQLNMEARKTLDQIPFYGYELGRIERGLRKVEERLRQQWMREQREAGDN